MNDDDMELLRDYAVRQSEEAFETLVSRHVGLVYSAALRQAGDTHLAEEITQTVFIILARKAGSLNPKTVLPGWLYRTTRYVASATLKMQRRREHYEQEAQMQATMEKVETGPVWEQLAPLLDEAMAQLRDKDRDAIVLRYFQNKSLRDVGAALGLDEYAAQKRVGRAVEKLRGVFYKRGVTSSSAGITGLISGNSVHAAPVALAKVATAAAMAKGAALAGSGLLATSGILKFMGLSKSKVVFAAILVMGIVLLGVGALAWKLVAIDNREALIRTQLHENRLPPEWKKRLEIQYENLREEEKHEPARDALSLLFPSLFPSKTTLYEKFSLELTPFPTVGFKGNQAMVIYNGMSYELADINGVPVPKILDFCHRQYGPLWDIRFSDDLVDVLTDMQHPPNAAHTTGVTLRTEIGAEGPYLRVINTNHTVDVSLRDPRTGQTMTVADVPVTKENRRDVFETLHPDTNQP